MCATLIGGLDRLKREYIELANQNGVRLKVLSGKESKIGPRIGNSDLVIIVTNMVSHEAKDQAARTAKSRKIPLCHLNSTSLKNFTQCLGNINNKSN